MRDLQAVRLEHRNSVDQSRCSGVSHKCGQLGQVVLIQKSSRERLLAEKGCDNMLRQRDNQECRDEFYTEAWWV